MKQINYYILERLHINKDTGNHHYNYHPKTRDELQELVKKLIKERGNEADLNDIDTSEITDMTTLIYLSKFNGDISEWDVSNAIIMERMFQYSEFTGENGDISKWDVSKVEDMCYMFYESEFNGDISKWDVSNVENMHMMFYNSKFTGNISEWDVSNVKDMEGLFYSSKFNGDISNWDVRNVKYMNDIFKYSPLQLKRNQSKRCKIIS